MRGGAHENRRTASPIDAAHLTDRPSITLPLCVLGAGLVHGLCIAALLPLLITVPGPGTSDGGDTLAGAKEGAAETGPGLLAVAEAKHEEAAPAPELVTGSIVQAGAAIASAIAKLPREDLRQTAPVLMTLAAAGALPETSLRTAASGVILVKADAMVIGATSDAAEELAAEAPPALQIKATDGDTAPEKPPSLARAEPTPAAASTRRKESAPAPVVRAKSKPRPAAVPMKRAAAPAKRTTPAARRPAQVRVQATKQPTGLGLFFRRPQPATRR